MASRTHLINRRAATFAQDRRPIEHPSDIYEIASSRYGIMSVIETDYLIVGAGASDIAFADALIAECEADVVIVDRRHGLLERRSQTGR